MVSSYGTSQSQRGATDAMRRSGGENVGDGERVMSAVLGGLMGLWGLRHGGIFGALSALIGGSMVARGVTGRCAMYRALDINTAHRQPDMRRMAGPSGGQGGPDPARGGEIPHQAEPSTFGS
jgi:hypothetical protein